MPVDPTIPLYTRTANIPNWTQFQGQQASLANMGLRNQLTQEEVRQSQMENQQREIALKDAQIAQSAYKDSGGDLGKYQDLLVQRGASPMYVNSLRNSMLKMQQQMAQTDEATAKAKAARWDLTSGRIDSMANDAEKDPQAFAAQWPTVLPGMVRDGLLTQQEADQIGHEYQGKIPTSSDLRAGAAHFRTASQLHRDAFETTRANSLQATADQKTLETAAQKLGAAGSQFDYGRAYYSLDQKVASQFPSPDQWTPDVQNSVRRMGMTPAQQVAEPGNTAKSKEAVRTDAAGQLAAQTDKDGYARAWYGLDPNVAKQFPHPDTFDPKTTPDQVRKLGMNPAQQSSAAHQQVQEQNEQKRLGMEQQRLELERRRLAFVNGTGPVDVRQGDAILYKYRLAENQLNRRRTQLGNAISTGKLYVDRLGNEKPMEQWSGGDEETKNAGLGSMRALYGDLTDELKKAIADKNSILQKLGRAVDVSTEDAWKALDAGDQKLLTPGAANPAAPAPAPKPAATPKPAAAAPAAKPAATPSAQPKFKYTEAQVRQRATAAGKDANAAVAAARKAKLIP